MALGRLQLLDLSDPDAALATYRRAVRAAPQDPDAHYGIWRSRWRRPLLRFALTHADVILAVDDTLRVEAMKRARYDGANIDVLPTGFDANFWKPGWRDFNPSVPVSKPFAWMGAAQAYT